MRRSAFTLCRRGACCAAVAAALLCAGCASWRGGEPAASAGDAPAAAALARQWLTDAGAAESAVVSVPPALAGWAAYGAALAQDDAATREDALRAVLSRARSPLLKATALRAVSEDLGFQGRQARFLRRYGFYANWFNRLLFSAGRVLQGNVQAVGQLFIDTVHDLFRPPEATEYERRALKLLRRREVLSSSGRVDQKELAKLEQAVERALAQADLERAGWALDHGDPDAALFYARQAEVRQPAWSRATDMVREADRRAAERRRAAVASGQVGYPDRTPQVLVVDPDLLRALLLQDHDGLASHASQALVAAALADYPASGRAQSSTRFRSWPAMLDARKADAAPDQRRWVAAMLGSPEQNPDLRLTTALERRRGQYGRYIFVGPERTRDRAYKAATWVNQTFDALQNVGIFYVFEVFGRAGQVIFAPPVPAEEVLNAQGAWLAHAPDPRGPEAREVAAEMAEELERQQRLDRARAVLEASGQLTPERKTKLDRKEALQWLARADALTSGPQRAQILARARSLSPELADKRARRWAKRRDPELEPYTLDTDWGQLATWAGMAAPADLPGEAVWFDGASANAEARGDVRLRVDPGAGSLGLSYPVVDGGGVLTVFERELPLATLPPHLRRLVALGREQARSASQNIQALDRLAIPFGVEGGLGASGIDFYPQLLPITPKPGEMELYQ